MSSPRSHAAKAAPRIIALFLLMLTLVATRPSASLAADSVADALNAYRTGQYGEALALFRKAAEQGKSDAAFHLGAMYFNGHGVTQDRDEATRWFRRAAVGGNREAQYILGAMYWDGRGVAKDYMSSYMWFDIASKNGNERAAQSVERIAASLSRPDISEAQRRAQACLESNYQRCD